MTGVVPVTLVTGFLGAGKTTLIARWLARRAAGERWAVLLNERGTVGLDPATPALGVVDIAAGCACCAALPVLQARLPALLRAGPWDRLVIEVDGAGHASRLVDALRRPPWAGRLRVEAIVVVVDATRAGPYRAPATPLAGLLASAQLEGAGRVVLTRDVGLPEAERSALRALLAAHGPFGRPVSGPDDAALQAAASPVAPPAGQRALRWPAEQRFDRARLQAAIAGLPTAEVERADAVFATQREWYHWHWDGRTWSIEASAYRLENRLEMRVSPAMAGATPLGAANAAPVDPAAEVARAWDSALSACRVGLPVGADAPGEPRHPGESPDPGSPGSPGALGDPR